MEVSTSPVERTHCVSESGRSSPRKKIQNSAFACTTEHGRIEAADAGLYSAPLCLRPLQDLDGIVIRRIESSCSTAIRSGTGICSQTLDVRGRVEGTRERGGRDGASAGLAVNGGMEWRARVAWRERVGEKRWAREMQCGRQVMLTDSRQRWGMGVQEMYANGTWRTAF
jgi:hypothetical protein